MKTHIAFGIKFICYSGPDDAVEVTWNILDVDNVNQCSQNFVFFLRKPWLTFFIFLHLTKSIYFLQETRFRHSTNKTTLDPPLHILHNKSYILHSYLKKVKLLHNEIVNVTADMLSMVCKDVRKEPTLHTTPDSNDKFRANISVCNFWQRLQRVFVDLRILYPLLKLSEPIDSNNDENNGKPEKKEIQPVNLRWWKSLFHYSYFYNQWWNEHGSKTML